MTGYRFSGGLPPIAMLRDLARRANAGEPLDELGSWLADALGRYLKEAPWGLSMEAAFGLETAPGQPRWWTQERLADRDEAIREFADKRFGGLNLGAKAEGIGRTAMRYASGRWQFDQNRDEMPAEYAGTKMEDLWHLMQISGGRVPTSGRQLRRILEDGRNESR